MQDNTLIFWILGGLIAAFVLGALIFNFIEWHHSFRRELDHLNSEIERTSGREQRYWKNRKKRLLLSIIPFVKY